MATTIELTVGAATSVSEIFDLPVPLTFGQQSDTYISILAIQPDPLQPPVTATYVIEHVGSTDQAAVPLTMGPTANIGTRATVELLSLLNGLAVIHIHHNTAIDPDDEEPWRLTVSHNGVVATDFFGVVDHSEAGTQVPRMALIIGSQLDPSPAELDFGLATFNVTKTLSVVAFNTGTADFDLDTITPDEQSVGILQHQHRPLGQHRLAQRPGSHRRGLRPGVARNRPAGYGRTEYPQAPLGSDHPDGRHRRPGSVPRDRPVHRRFQQHEL